MIKKYLMRIIGAVCILGAMALMFMPSWMELDDIQRRDLRNLRSDVSGMCSAAMDSFITSIEYDDDFKEELKDYDLPYTQGRIKSRFKEIEGLSAELLNDNVSLQEVLTLSVKVPGLIQDAENLLDSEGRDVFFHAAAGYIVYEGSQALSEEYDPEMIEYNADLFMDATEDGLAMISDFTFVFILLAAVLILILALGVASAITHICNKGRWLKYLLLAIMVIMVAGSCVALPIAADMLADMVSDMPAFEDLTLKITATPFIAVVLMIVPVVLDIVFERKKETILAEE